MFVKCMISLMSLLLLLTAETRSYAQRSITKSSLTTNFGKYKPREPISLNELPKAVRQRLEAHLTERLGAEFYSKLKLSGGQIVDFDELYRVEPDARNYKWTVFAYGLSFMFSEPKQGLKAYHARILLDAAGNVLEEIDLPEIAKHPEKATLISLAAARKLAAKNGFPLDKTRVEIYYDRELGSLIWELEYKLKGNMYVWVDRSIRIDAHTGRVIGQGDAEKFF